GRKVTTFATVNDVHFGETACGLLGLPEEIGPIFRAEPDAEPYPEVMNRGVIEAMDAIDPSAVLVKGGLTDAGSDDEYAAVLRAYGHCGARLHHIRGNHDAMTSTTIAAHGPFTVELPGVTLAVLDTVRPGSDKGRLPAAQIDWLDTLAHDSAAPLLVFG